MTQHIQTPTGSGNRKRKRNCIFKSLNKNKILYSQFLVLESIHYALDFIFKLLKRFFEVLIQTLYYC